MMKLIISHRPRGPKKRSDRKEAKKPTWTSLILDTLVQSDDFMSVPQLMAATGANSGQATAALHHLFKFKAVESVASGGNLWWFATPELDQRMFILEERVPEEPGTRCRRGCRKELRK